MEELHEYKDYNHGYDSDDGLKSSQQTGVYLPIGHVCSLPYQTPPFPKPKLTTTFTGIEFWTVLISIVMQERYEQYARGSGSMERDDVEFVRGRSEHMTARSSWVRL